MVLFTSIDAQEKVAGLSVFTEKSTEYGLNYKHHIDSLDASLKPPTMAGGFAIADVNGDGWDDVLVMTGAERDAFGNNLNPNKLLIADQQGGYVDRANEYGLSSNDLHASGPVFADFDGDGWRDLIMGGVFDLGNNKIRYYRNNSGQSFTDMTASSGLPDLTTYGVSAADIDGDGDLDLALTHWESSESEILWENNGGGQFTDVTAQWMPDVDHLYTFTASFAHINDDLDMDLMIASDFGNSNYFHGTSLAMVQQDQNHLTDQNGMGSVLGDYDNDGDLDWFVTSIYSLNQNKTGNRLYRNDGNGIFTDVSLAAGVQDGSWGWGACFADFNNDGWLDIYQTNGFTGPDFEMDTAKLFMNQSDGTFQEQAQQFQVADDGMGRAILCFDHNQDGKVDILLNNNNQDSKFFQNNIQTNNHYLKIKLRRFGSNMDAIGARIEITLAGGEKLYRDVMVGNSYVSSIPTTQHFGLGQYDVVDLIDVTWPDGSVTSYTSIAADQMVTLFENEVIFINDFE